ncbi:hypothetical protein KEM55_001367, partial [Ascosphaera atra]
MVEQAVKYLKNFLSPGYWNDIDVQLFPKILEPILASEKAEKPDDAHTTAMVNALQVVRILLGFKSDQWVLTNMQSIRSLLEKSLRSENPEVQDCLHGNEDESGLLPKLPPPIKRILDALPTQKREEDDSMDIDGSPLEVISYLNSIATEGLAGSNGRPYIYAINTLWTLSKCRPDEIDQHMGGILKVLSHKLAKDHVAAYLPKPPANVAPRTEVPPIGSAEFEVNVDLLSKTIDLVCIRMSVLGDQRRPFLSIVGQVVERSQSQRLCLKILDMTKNWIFDSTESWPTVKEKAA